MANKVYAVKEGYKVGIFSSWDECQKAIKGYSGAKFKSFSTEDEARAYLDGKALAINNVGNFIEIAKPTKGDVANIFIGGSNAEGIISFGIHIQSSNKDYRFDGAIETTQYGNLKGIAGKLLGVLAGVQLAVQLGYTKLNIYSNYEGLKYFYTGEWSAKGDLQQKYHILLKDMKEKLGVDYRFFVVNGKTGGVDRLAKRAINLGHFVEEWVILCGELKTKNLYISYI